MDRKVSVIIPNYNYARFLQRRVNCIVNQTIKPAEIIFLDDCSSDDSLKIAEEILSKTDIPYQIIANETNQGVFKQWLKGIELIQHDYFWIAEADDYCELNFLETLLPAFDDKDVVISYSNSYFITDSGELLSEYGTYVKDYFEENIWNKSFNCLGTDFYQQFLSVENVLPNASAVLIAKGSIDKEKIEKISNYLQTGDWFFYIQIMLKNSTNKISYNGTKLNYFVRHTSSVFGSNKYNTLLSETINIYGVVDYSLSKNVLDLRQKKIIQMLSNYLLTEESFNKLFNNNLYGDFFQIFHKLNINTIELQKYKHDLAWYKNQMDKYWEESQQLKSDLSWHKGQMDKYWEESQQLKYKLERIKNSLFWRLVIFFRKITKIFVR